MECLPLLEVWLSWQIFSVVRESRKERFKFVQVLASSDQLRHVSVLWCYLHSIFLPIFMLACGTHKFLEWSPMWLFQFLLKELLAPSLNSQLWLSSMMWRRIQKTELTSYKKAMNYLLEPYAFKDIIVEPNAFDLNFLHRTLAMTPSRCVHLSCSEAFRSP